MRLRLLLLPTGGGDLAYLVLDYDGLAFLHNEPPRAHVQLVLNVLQPRILGLETDLDNYRPRIVSSSFTFLRLRLAPPGGGRGLTRVAEARGRGVPVAGDDLARVAGDVDDAVVAELEEGAGAVVAGDAADVEADVAAVGVAAQVVTAVDEGGAEGVGVRGLRDEAAARGEEGDGAEVGGDGERRVDADLGWRLGRRGAGVGYMRC